MAQRSPGVTLIHRWRWRCWPAARLALWAPRRSHTGRHRRRPARPIDRAALFARAQAPGATLGAAFMAARMGMMRDTLPPVDARRGRPEDLLEFVLYGDPTLVVTGSWAAENRRTEEPKNRRAKQRQDDKMTR